MDQQQILDEALAKVPSLKRNKGGDINGSAAHGLEMKTRRTLERAGMSLDEAYRFAAPAFRAAIAKAEGRV